MKLGIIILCWRNKASTKKLLLQLINWQLKDAVIALVQNECERDDFSEIDHSSVIKICNTDNLGFGGGANAGIKVLKDYAIDWVLLLNTDISLDKEVILRLHRRLKSNAQTFAVGPKIVETCKNKTNIYIGGQNIAKHINTRIVEQDNLRPVTNAVVEVDYVPGAVLLLNNQLLKRVGNFDEDFFFSGEVAELCYRAKRLGYKCEILLDLQACHQTENSSLRNTLYKYYNFRNRFLFMQKHPSEKKYLLKWCRILFKELLYQMVQFNLDGVRTMAITILHVILKIKGNQNHKFVKSKNV